MEASVRGRSMWLEHLLVMACMILRTPAPFIISPPREETVLVPAPDLLQRQGREFSPVVSLQNLYQSLWQKRSKAPRGLVEKTIVRPFSPGGSVQFSFLLWIPISIGQARNFPDNIGMSNENFVGDLIMLESVKQVIRAENATEAKCRKGRL